MRGKDMHALAGFSAVPIEGSVICKNQVLIHEA